MIDAAIEEFLDVPFTFRRRPRAIPCAMRPVWRLHVLVLILDQCRGGRASLEQLHVLNWAIRSEESRLLFLQFVRGYRAPNQIVVRYDPSLSRAVDFAFAERLVARHESQLSLFGEQAQRPERKSRVPHYRIILGERGRALARQIHQTEDAFVVEKQFLQSIGRKVSQEQVQSLFTWSNPS